MTEMAGQPCERGTGTALRIECHLDGEVHLPDHWIALDALVAYAVVIREGLPPLDCQPDRRPVPIEIPIEREPGGRFHLATLGVYTEELHRLTYQHRRFPLDQAQTLGLRTIRRVQIDAGPSKSYRIPRPVTHVAGDVIRFWCVGDADRLRVLLELIMHLGRKRAAGMGRIRAWTVEPCEPWGPGFPVVGSDGKPLRQLPLDWPGLVEPQEAIRRITYPYYSTWVEEELLAVPEWL